MECNALGLKAGLGLSSGLQALLWAGLGWGYGLFMHQFRLPYPFYRPSF
jgi:hypothetical protein